MEKYGGAFGTLQNIVGPLIFTIINIRPKKTANLILTIIIID